mgnify:CR=1 FL=1
MTALTILAQAATDAVPPSQTNLFLQHLLAAVIYSVLGIVILNVTLFGALGATIWAIQMVWIPFWAAGVINGISSFTPLLIEQGEGHIVNTASMAGMVSMPWGGTYNVSKHGVVTLSETLWADLQLAGATGVGVSVLCPGWVQTRIAESGRNRPVEPGAAPVERSEEELATMAHVGNLVAEGLNPKQVAELVVDSVRTGRFYIFTHPTWMPLISDRFDRITSGEGPGFAPLPGMGGEEE